MTIKGNKKLAVIGIVILCVIATFFVLRKKEPSQIVFKVNYKTAKLASIPDDYYRAINLAGDEQVNIVFSPDGTKVAYVVKRSLKESVFVNNTEGAWYDEIVDGPYFSADGKHMIYQAKEGDSYVMVSDGTEHGRYYFINRFVFDVRSGKFAFETLDKESQKFQIVFNGTKGPFFDWIYGNVIISPIGNTATYYGCDKENSQHYCYVVAQNENGTYNKSKTVIYRESKNISDTSPLQYSPDGKLLAFIERISETDSINVNGSIIFPSTASKVSRVQKIIFNHDGSRMAYVQRDCESLRTCNSFGTGGNYYLVVDNKKSSGYQNISNVTFSPDGKRIAFSALTSRGVAIVVDGQEYYPNFSAKIDSVQEIVFSNNNKDYIFTYVGSDKKIHLIYNNEEIGKSYTGIFLPRFTVDGKIVFIAGTDADNTVHLVINEKEIAASKFLFPVLSYGDGFYSSVYRFTPDGKSILYGLMDGKDLWWKVESI